MSAHASVVLPGEAERLSHPAIAAQAFKLRGQEGDFDPLSTSVSSSLAQQQNAQQNFPLAYKRGLGVLYLGIAWQIQQHKQC